MRKSVIDPVARSPRPHLQEKWLDLKKIAKAQVTSEDPNFPIEYALSANKGVGWRAAKPGDQIIRLVLDNPTPVRRIRLEFSEAEFERTQQFTLRWSEAGGPLKEIARQQWNFSPQGSTSEIEDYAVDIENVSVLELNLRPDLTRQTIFATLDAWRVA
jgi:uncharacterized protein (DUF736 family)